MIKKFKILTDPDTHNNEDGTFSITSDLVAVTPSGIQIIVPAGFVSDGASIPWVAQWLIPKEGKWNRPAIVHDYLYQTGKIGDWIINQRIADAIYLGLMECREVPAWNRKTQYRILRMFGNIQWNKYRNKDKRKAS